MARVNPANLRVSNRRAERGRVELRVLIRVGQSASFGSRSLTHSTRDRPFSCASTGSDYADPAHSVPSVRVAIATA